ncbi:MAG TPA: type II toxin-antitoxin system RelE/ParE family toxin [Sedimentisphaerales bacterium]|nr:type II toxin-antitoxin system RelE/ParE family toxin [Sedimentisphaerales bacterium]
MKYQVLVVAEAEEDIFDIYKYVLRADGRNRADHLLRRLQQTCQSLARMPNRGHSPPELDRVGVRAYREVHFKPYRIIYQIKGRKVFIHCVLDGRRAVQDVLERRVLR